CAVAAWLADRGAGAIVLNGRRGPDAAADEIISGLRARGVTVEVELADITDTAAVDRMLDRVDRELPPLAGVIHSVGVLSDGALTNQSWERFEQVLWPKVLGAWHLHRATLDRDLDMFCLFSSRVGVMGNPGQSNHASANAFLDQLAGHRRALGLAGQAIAWGAWSEIGEAAEQRERIDQRRSALGGRWFTPRQGIRAFERLVRQDVTNSVVMAMDWSVFEEAVEERPPLLDELLSTDSEDGEDASATPKDVLSQLGETPTTAREDLLVSFLQGEVQAVLRLPSAPAPTIGFFDLGMDSLMAVELRNRLNRAFSGTYTAPNTLVFDYPDIASLATHLAGELVVDGGAPAPGGPSRPPGASTTGEGEARTPDAPPEPPSAPSIQAASDAIAIVGMACRFPGAPDLAAFWRQLEAGADLVTDGRMDGGPWHGVAGDPGATDPVSRRGAFLDDIDKFDGRFFRIPPIEARTMDPRQRLLLETTWHALEDAGIDPEGLRGSSTGAYVGVTSGDYRDLAAAAGEFHGYLGTTPSVTAGRIAFALGLAGPAVPVDVACASSLAAVHQAVSALRQDEVELALVGGVNAILHPEVSVAMAEMGLLSKRGRCSTFDAAADGFVRGEGCGVVVLKRLAEAEANGDRIWGVIRGSAVNQNGASAGLTVPNGPAQERVIEEALSRAGIAPGEVDYLEANGVGSDLGDPIEVQAAAAVYGRGRDPERPLLIGSVKTNIGHLECAAGVASLIKAVLAMNEGRIPRQLHFNDPNPHLEWERLPVRVTSADTDWPSHADRPPRAGISSFGLSGTNAHVVVEGAEQPDGTRRRDAGPAWPAGAAQTIAPRLPEQSARLPVSPAAFVPRDTRILPLSGKSPDALRQLALRYLAWLDEREAAPSANGAALESLLADMAWTAGAGRSHFARRAAIPFQTADSLREALRAIADHRPTGVHPPAPEADTPRKLAFAYPGEGSEQVGMGRDIYDCEPVARAVLDRCDAILREARAGASLLDVMFGRDGTDGRLHDPEWAQPAIYALECALTALWASVGIRPAIAVGEGVGELAAAWTAGVFTLEDGLRFAAARGTAMARPKARVAAAMPTTDPSAPAADPFAELEATYAEIETSPPSLTLLSRTTGQPINTGQAPGWDHWRDQLLAPKPLHRCNSELAALDAGPVLEIGPQATSGPIELAAWPAAHDQSNSSFPESVARAYQAGLPVSFAGLFAGETRRRIPLPGYPFERARHWIETAG
ncbi:MAG: SDR family oxidoreductase, partial [Gemmatimonadetes bacterium]|nr:SDR family oxidoreductase [Gemmatimonadota bacterium]